MLGHVVLALAAEDGENNPSANLEKQEAGLGAAAALHRLRQHLALLSVHLLGGEPAACETFDGREAALEARVIREYGAPLIPLLLRRQLQGRCRRLPYAVVRTAIYEIYRVL